MTRYSIEPEDQIIVKDNVFYLFLNIWAKILLKK